MCNPMGGPWGHYAKGNVCKKYLYPDSKTKQKQKNWTPRKIDQICGYQWQVVRDGGIGWRWLRYELLVVSKYWGCTIKHDNYS